MVYDYIVIFLQSYVIFDSSKFSLRYQRKSGVLLVTICTDSINIAAQCIDIKQTNLTFRMHRLINGLSLKSDKLLWSHN